MRCKKLYVVKASYWLGGSDEPGSEHMCMVGGVFTSLVAANRARVDITLALKDYMVRGHPDVEVEELCADKIPPGIL